MPRLSRITSNFACTFLLLATVALAGCSTETEQADVNATQAPATNLPAIPRPEPALDRTALLAAIAQAASATATGAEMPEEVRSLDGRQFEIRIRFGCRGPSTDLASEWLAWSYDPEDRTLRIRARPTIDSEEPLLAKLGADDFESVEGFWLPRPWILQATCPAGAAVKPQQQRQQPDGGASEPERSDPQVARNQARPRHPDTSGKPANDRAIAASIEPRPDAGEPIPKAPRVGIAQFFTADDARTRRRDSRPYSTVKTLSANTPLSSQGFNLVLSGRLRALADKGVIQCTTAGADSPPECVVSAEFQRVRIERPDSKEIIAEWGTG